MPRRKCDSDVTDARAPPPRGPARRPVWPRVGDLVRCVWTDTRVIEGIVIDARDRGWKPPMLTILTNDGERMLWSSPNVKVISNRRRKRRRK